MKGHYKKPKRVQKEYISGNGLDAEDWLIEKEEEEYLYLVSRERGNKRKISKNNRECRRYGSIGTA